MRTDLSLLLVIALGTSAAAPAPPRILMDQLGFEADGPKRAVVADAGDRPLPWTVTDARGRVVARGETRPFGPDRASGDRVQLADLATLRTPGEGYMLEVAGVRSRPFAVAAHPFRALKYDALGYFYETRSGVPIEARFTPRADLARPAGHRPDRAPCITGPDRRGTVWPGCPYTLDVTGGWYDAGDQGKYVVNGGASVWHLLNAWERTHGGPGRPDASFDDGRVRIPEAGNGQPDLLDEARWELDFLLRMQVPAGARLQVAEGVAGARSPPPPFREIDATGLVHLKVADLHWTKLPTPPQDDPEPRRLYPVSTSATLNLAAVAAQGARVWRTLDPAFSARCLQAARAAYAAAERHPDIFVVGDFDGSGGYGDPHLDDERWWAAAELFATTGEDRYGRALHASPLWGAAPGAGMSDISWADTAGMGAASLLTAPDHLSPSDRATLRAAWLKGADAYLAQGRGEGYLLPYAPGGYPWGSNGALLDHAVVLGLAYDLTGERRYRDGAVDALDYVLGRNPLDQSYVTGYGARPMLHPHHRFWAKQFDPRMPDPPPGVLSGGPNSTAMVDDVSRTLKGGCAPERCWLDDARAFTFNEVAINWNAPLFWVAAFVDGTAQAPG